MEYYAKSGKKILSQEEIDKVRNELENLIINLEEEFTETDLKVIKNNIAHLQDTKEEEQKTLKEHQDDIVRCAEMFFLEYGEYFTEKEKCLVTEACRIHDWGKVNLIFQRLVNPNLIKKMYPDIPIRDWTFENVSGGTTGEPVKFRHSGKFFETDQGAKLLFDEWSGRKIGDYQIRLWGSERDIVSGKKDWMNKIYRWMRNEVFLNTFVMSEDVIKKYINVINETKPKMILAYVQSIMEIVKYANLNHIEMYSPRGIMTSAGTLDEQMLEEIQKVFKCPVLNRYGSREMGDMACSCNKNEGLHINTFVSYIEVLDGNYESCNLDEEGQLIVSLLSDYSMPIIRYAIGDRGALSSKTCTCGRGLPMLKCVTGRIIDFFKTMDGRIVYGDYFTHLFYPCTNVKQFQVIQDAIDHILVKLVFFDKDVDNKGFYFEKENEIKKAMGEGTKVDFKIVDDIPVSKSGKRIYTICQI